MGDVDHKAAVMHFSTEQAAEMSNVTSRASVKAGQQPMNPRLAHVMNPRLAHVMNPRLAHVMNPRLAHVMNPRLAHVMNPRLAHVMNPRLAHVRSLAKPPSCESLRALLNTSGQILETFLKHFPKIFLRQTILNYSIGSTEEHSCYSCDSI